MKKFVLVSAGLLICSATLTAGISKYQRAVNVPAAPAEKNVLMKKEFAPLTKVNETAAQEVRAGQIVKHDLRGFDIVKTDKGYSRAIAGNPMKLHPYKGQAPAVATAAAPALSQNFEGWDGKTGNWLPAGWRQTHKSTEFSASEHPEWTWATSAGGWYTYAVEGNYIAAISTAFDIDMETFTMISPNQDEWMITPDVAVSAGDRLAFLLQYSPGWTLIDNDKLNTQNIHEFSAANTNLEVLVSADGTNWEKVWDAIENDAKKNYTEAELEESLYSYGWIGVTADLAKYAGKTVKIAFRYVGSAGQDLAVDFVQVASDIKADAAYIPPMNYLVWGSTMEGNYIPYARSGEPFQDAVWKNASIFADESEWEYSDVETQNGSFFATTRNLTTNYPYAMVDYPALTTTVGNSTAAYKFGCINPDKNLYSWFCTGGSPEMDWGDGSPVDYYPAVNYEFANISRIVWFGDLTVDAEIAAGWEEVFADKKIDAAFEGFGSYIPAPAKSYAMNGVYLQLIPNSIKGNKDFPIEVTVYRITDSGTLGSVIGKGSCTVNDGTTDRSGLLRVPCGFYEKVGAVEQQVSLTIDSAVMVVVSAKFSDLEYAFPSMLSTNQEALLGYYNFYIMGRNKKDGSLAAVPANGFGIPVNPENPDGDWDTFTGFGLSFDVTYPWLMTEGSKEFEANRAGDSKTFQFSSYYVPDAYEVEGEGLDEWYTVTVGEIDPNTYLTPVTIEVDPFTGEDARVAAVNFTVPGSKETIWVAQHSASSVDNVAASATKAAVEGGNFVVESANATAVAVYNVAGQKVASAAIEGKTVIPAADLANGMYILKFNDNTVVKVVK